MKISGATTLCNYFLWLFGFKSWHADAEGPNTPGRSYKQIVQSARLSQSYSSSPSFGACFRLGFNLTHCDMEDVIPALPWGTGALRQRVLSRWFTLEQAEYCIFADIFKFKTLLRKFASVWDLSFFIKKCGVVIPPSAKMASMSGCVPCGAGGQAR